MEYTTERILGPPEKDLKESESMSYVVWSTDYGHTMTKSLILCGPNSNPNPK